MSFKTPERGEQEIDKLLKTVESIRTSSRRLSTELDEHLRRPLFPRLLDWDEEELEEEDTITLTDSPPGSKKPEFPRTVRRRGSG